MIFRVSDTFFKQTIPRKKGNVGATLIFQNLKRGKGVIQMKKMISLAMIALLAVCVASADEDWRVVKADYDVYRADREAAKAAFDSGDYALAHKLFMALADTAHCARRPAVKACQLNSAAYSLIKLNEDKEGLISADVARKCLAILAEAKKLSDKICGSVIDQNIAYCEARL